MQSRDRLTFIITIIYRPYLFLHYIGTMLTGYLYIYLHNAYTTAVCEVCACVRACVGLVAVCVVGVVTFAPDCNVTCGVDDDVVSRNK